MKVNDTCCQKLVEEALLHTINEDERFFDPNCEEINNTFVRLSQIRNEISDVDFSVDYDDDYLAINNEEPSLSEEVRTSGSVIMSNIMISDDSMKEMIRSLNSQRRKIFDEVYIWCKSTCKYQSLLTKKKVNPLIVFTSRGAGVGKSYLINTIFQTLARTFNLYCDTSEKVKVLNKTSTGVAPANINGTTINFALGIPTTKGKDIPKLRDKVRCKLHLMYSELEEVIIDEIYMVSNISYIRFIAGFM